MLTIPNILTLFRAALILPIVVCAMVQPPRFMAVSLVLLWLAFATDILDGLIARAMNQRTDFGAFLDATTDKVLMLATMFALLALGGLAWWLVFPMFLRDMATDGLRAFCASRGAVTRAFIWGKIKFGLQFAAVNAAMIGLMQHDAARASGWYLLANVLLAAALAVGMMGTVPIIRAFRAVQGRREAGAGPPQG